MRMYVRMCVCVCLRVGVNDAAEEMLSAFLCSNHWQSSADGPGLREKTCTGEDLGDFPALGGICCHKWGMAVRHGEWISSSNG